MSYKINLNREWRFIAQFITENQSKQLVINIFPWFHSESDWIEANESRKRNCFAESKLDFSPFSVSHLTLFFFIIHGKLSFAFFCLVPVGIVHSDGLVRFPLCARALTPPFELFVNAILSSHGVMRFLLARRESPCNKNSSSNSMVHNKNLFLLVSVQGKSSFARIYRTKRKIGNEGGEIDERRREHDAGYTRSRKTCLLYYT